MLFLDTSALAKLYFVEAGSAAVFTLVKENVDQVSTSVATYAEVLSALARGLKEKRLSNEHHQAQKRAFSGRLGTRSMSSN
ncbi:MAG: type II toxin-antitoxin system VapC family toxin [Acidobacteria bacterium]|nr:type II toxin-antitoxin system VapC family toxin [Acidobacteriota bacterium]